MTPVKSSAGTAPFDIFSALSLFEAGQTTLAQSARLADLAMEEFIELLGEVGLDAVDYPAEELAEELEAAL